MKLITTVATISFVLSLANSSIAATWRSRSGQTAIPNLDSICWGNDTINSVQTVFGNNSYIGSISFDYVRTKGCVPGNKLVGNFTFYNANDQCKGLITVTWRKDNNAYIQWDIINPGSRSACPVDNTHWEINTYPVAQETEINSAITSPTGAAIVFAPPSNVRATPNGSIICSVRSIANIDIYGSVNGWYKTDVCGSMGYIHHSQIRF